MRPLRAIGGWAGFAVALGVLVALDSARAGAVASADGADGAQRLRRSVRASAPSLAAPAPAVAPGAAALPVRALAPVRRIAATALRALGTVATYTVYGAVLGLLLALTVPLAFGMRPLVVLSGSMQPLLHVGDVTVVERIAPRDARVGDVVTFKAPGSGRVTTHRLRASRRTESGRYAFTTKGDANNAIERWTLPADGQLSRAVYRVPLVGRALLVIRTPLGWALLVALPLLVLGTQEIARIWRRAPEPGDAPLAA